MNESELEQNYLELKEDFSIIAETAAQKNYRLNYPVSHYETIPEIETSGMEQIIDEFEPYLRNRSLITAPPSAPPEDLLGVIYAAYEMNHLDRRLAEAMIASKMTYIPDLIKLQSKGEVIYEASLLEIAKKCYEQRQRNIIYQRNFVGSCQRFMQTEPCIRAQSQMKSLDISIHEAPLEIEEEKTCLRIDNLEVLDKELEVDPFKHTDTWVSNPLSPETIQKQETITLEFSSAVLQKLNYLLPEHKKKSIINTDYSCVNLQSYLRDCLASQKVITEYDRNKSLRKHFEVAKKKYIFNLTEIADKISTAQRAKYSDSSTDQKYSIADLKTDLQKYYTEFKQACLYNKECHLSGPSLVEDFCKKALSDKSFVHTDEFISFLEQIKQVAVTCDPQDIRLYVVNNEPYLYGTKKSVQQEVQTKALRPINSISEKEVSEIDFILPSIPENDEIDKKNVPHHINVGGQGILDQQVRHRLVKRSNTHNAYTLSLEKKVIDNLNNTYHKAKYTEEIAKLDEKIIQEADILNTNLHAALIHKQYSESNFHKLEKLFNSIKSDLNTQHELIKKRANLVLPTYVERFEVASKLTKSDSYHQDLLKTAFIKTERFLDNIEIIYCHPARMTEMHCAVIWKAQQSGLFTKELADLLLSIRHESLPDHYKYLLDSDGVIKKASFLESGERVYQALSSSKIDFVREQFAENYDQFTKLDCHQNDNDSLLIVERLHNLRIESSLSEQEVLQVNKMSENPVLQASSSQELSSTVSFEHNTKNKFVCFNEAELQFFNQLLRECEETNNSLLRYSWQINLRELMKEVSSIPELKQDESNEPFLRLLDDEDLEDKCYSKIANIIYRAKSSLDHSFRGESISFGSYINHDDPDSINRAFNEEIKKYEENNKQTMKCNLYGDELIDRFIEVSHRKIQGYYQQAEENKKQVYKKEKSELSILQRNKKRSLKNEKKLTITELKKDCKIAENCILKMGEFAKKHGPENILLNLNPSLSHSVELYQEGLSKEKLGYFIRQQKIEPGEDSTQTIKKALKFNMNREKGDECKWLEKKCDRLSGCSFWEAPCSTSREDNSFVETSFETSNLKVPMSKYSCLSR